MQGKRTSWGRGHALALLVGWWLINLKMICLSAPGINGCCALSCWCLSALTEHMRILKGKRTIILKDVVSALNPTPSLPHASSTLRHRRYILIKLARSLEGHSLRPHTPCRPEAILANVDAGSNHLFGQMIMQVHGIYDANFNHILKLETFTTVWINQITEFIHQLQGVKYIKKKQNTKDFVEMQFRETGLWQYLSKSGKRVKNDVRVCNS